MALQQFSIHSLNNLQSTIHTILSPLLHNLQTAVGTIYRQWLQKINVVTMLLLMDNCVSTVWPIWLSVDHLCGSVIVWVLGSVFVWLIVWVLGSVFVWLIVWLLGSVFVWLIVWVLGSMYAGLWTCNRSLGGAHISATYRPFCPPQEEPHHLLGTMVIYPDAISGR